MAQNTTSDETGGYFVYEDTAQGVASFKWSKTFVPGALLFAKPPSASAIPAFKFKGGGRNELQGQIQANKQRWYIAICSFVKEARKFKCELVLLPEIEKARLPTQVVYHMPSNEVKRLEVGKSYPSTLCDAVASLHPDNNCLEAHTMELGLFARKGNTEGWCISF